MSDFIMKSIEEMKNKRLAWEKATEIPGYDPAIWRRDSFGSVIRYSDYGDRQSEYGWEKDHIIPKGLGGLGMPSNLQALHWRNNVKKSDHLIGGLGNLFSNLQKNK